MSHSAAPSGTDEACEEFLAGPHYETDAELKCFLRSGGPRWSKINTLLGHSELVELPEQRRPASKSLGL